MSARESRGALYWKNRTQLPYVSLPSTTVVIVLPFFVIFVIFVRSAERERCVRVFDGDDERWDVRDDGLGNEFRPSFTLNFTLNILYNFFFLFFSLRCWYSVSFRFAPILRRMFCTNFVCPMQLGAIHLNSHLSIKMQMVLLWFLLFVKYKFMKLWMEPVFPRSLFLCAEWF